MLSVRSANAFLAADERLVMTGGSWFGKATAVEQLPVRRIKMVASPSADRWQEPRDIAVLLLKNPAIASSAVIILLMDRGTR